MLLLLFRGGKCQNVLVRSKAANTKALHGIEMDSITTLGQQYNVGEKPTVILYTHIIINRHAGTPERQQKQNRQ